MHADLFGDPLRGLVIGCHVGSQIGDAIGKGMLAHDPCHLCSQTTAMKPCIENVTQVVALLAHQFQQEDTGITDHCS